MNQNLTYNLKRAQESGKRYKPLDKNLTQSVFEELQISIDQMFGLIDKLENKSYQVPPLTASEPHVNLLDKLDLFLQKSYKKLISSLTQSFEEFTNSTINSFSAFENLFLSANNHHQSDNLTTADLTHLSLHKSGNQLTLITLPTIVNELQQLGKVKIELESGIQAAFGLANEDGILSTEAQQTLENITNAFVTLLNTPSKLDTYQTGCLQHPFQPRLNHSNPILLDVYLCLVHRYSSTNTQISLSAEMAELLEELKTNQLEVQQQQEVCNQLLCEAAEIPFESNCTLTIEQLKDLTAVLQLALMPSIEDCNSQLDRAKYDFDQFVVDYKTRLLVDYNWATQLATAIKQNYTKIRDYIGKPINKHRSDLENISSNMTAYISGNITYENFSQTFIKTFKAWLDQSFNVSLNAFINYFKLSN